MTTRNPGEDDVPSVDLSRFDNDFADAPVEEKEFDSVPDGKYQVNVDKVEITTAKTTGNPMLKWTLKILAPRFRASSTKGQWCRLVEIELHAQITIYFEWTKLSGSTPPVGPTVSSHAVDEPEAQKVFSFTVEPNLLKKASPEVRPCTRPSLPR